VRDLQLIEEAAKRAGASALICTEKDSFNLGALKPSMDLFVCRISLRVAREQEFWATLTKIAAAHSAPGAHVDR